MSLRIAILSLACIAPLTARATAGTVVFDATGTVANTPNAATLLQYPGLMLNDVVHLRFEAFTPGTPPPPGTGATIDLNYAIDVPTFTLTLGATTKTLSAAALPLNQVGMADLPDRVTLYPAGLVGGGNLSFDFGASSNLMLTAANPLLSIGSWTAPFYSSYSFMVNGPSGAFIDVNFLTFSIAIVQTGTPFCFGDGSDTPCPCANSGLLGRGCQNTFGTGGASLSGSGVASISNDTLVLHAANTGPFQFGLYYEGSTTWNPTAPFAIGFGNGLRCVGATAVNRLEIRGADGLGASATTVPLGFWGSAVSGTTYYYQLWYRDGVPPTPIGTCITSGFNFSNAVMVTWSP